MNHPRPITTPLDEETVRSLRAGDRILLSGTVLTARDAAHRRMHEALLAGKPLPVDVRGQVLFYVGPTPARPGRPIGSAGPTTAGRMDPYTPVLIQHGLRGMIGKGFRSREVKEAMRQYGAVYFAATGGAGALLARCVKTAEIVAYEDLGTEAIRRLEVEDLPLIVANDSHGGDLYEESTARYRVGEF